jgi:hypothetical protein
MQDKLSESLQSWGIVIEGVFLKDGILSDQLCNSIEPKAEAEQDSKHMEEFPLYEEGLDVKRKAIKPQFPAYCQ